MRYIQTLSLVVLVGILMMPVVPVHAGLLLSEKDKAKLEEKTSKTSDVNSQWLMAYYVGYQHGYLKPRDVDYSIMTHIVVGGVSVNANGTLDEHWHMENGDGEDMALDVGKRARKAGVKTLVWLGGPNEEDKFLSASSDAYRKEFVKNIVALVDELRYDGVDIDWEPIRKKDEASVLALVKDLRKADPDLIITLPVNWVPTTVVGMKDMSIYKEIARYVDRVFIMSYSMAGPWPGWDVWHGGALAGDSLTTPGSVKSSVRAYLHGGVPKEKLGIGIGTYATCWEYPVKAPRQRVPSTFYPSDIGVMTMRAMMDDYYVKRYEKWDAKAEAPYLTYKRAKGEWDCGFISYENEQSITAKMEYVNDEDLGGAIVWNIGTGYYPKNSKSKRHPLLKTAWDTLVNN